RPMLTKPTVTKPTATRSPTRIARSPTRTATRRTSSPPCCERVGVATEIGASTQVAGSSRDYKLQIRVSLKFHLREYFDEKIVCTGRVCGYGRLPWRMWRRAQEIAGSRCARGSHDRSGCR